MLEKKFILEHLEKTNCPKCGSSLKSAEIVPISEAPIAWIGHAVCPKCKAESMVTITQIGAGIVQVQSDMRADEYNKFIGASAVSYDEVIDLHKALKKKNIWNLLHKKEKSLEKAQNI
jgi:uncharacterized protein (UPF0212 family)